jgi:hypothetical protein
MSGSKFNLPTVDGQHAAAIKRKEDDTAAAAQALDLGRGMSA